MKEVKLFQAANANTKYTVPKTINVLFTELSVSFPRSLFKYLLFHYVADVLNVVFATYYSMKAIEIHLNVCFSLKLRVQYK